MSEERRPARPPGAEGQVKVVDRRRFSAEGGPAAEEPAEGGAPGGAERPTGEAAAPAADERDAHLSAQAARIDELSRAYAALVEDNRAFRNRMEREKARVVEADRARLSQVLLEAADDLERALAAVSGAGEPQGAALEGLVHGVRLTLGQLQRHIASLGAERIQVVGQRFDPQVAEAVDTVPVADASQDEVVLQEIRPGYRIGDRILRPARVRVGRLARA
jgi:molecular chaperone GrpE